MDARRLPCPDASGAYKPHPYCLEGGGHAITPGHIYDAEESAVLLVRFLDQELSASSKPCFLGLVVSLSIDVVELLLSR